MIVYDSFKQYSDEWWDVRRGIPTASMFDKIITPAKGELSKQASDYACQLIADRHDPMYGPDDGPVTAAMKNGTDCEPEARAWYQVERGVNVREVGFITTDCGRFGTSPDGMIGDEGVLELKCPLAKTQIAYLLDGGLPNAYKTQVHGHLAVTGAQWCDFMSYYPDLPPLLVRVEPNEFTAKLADALEEFDAMMKDMLKQLNLPEPKRAEPITEDDLPAMLAQ